MSAVGSLLCEYRKKHHLSQLDLGMLAEVSPRHISFIETGRTNPSRSMLLKLADVLQLPLGDSNLLLHSGGFTAAYSQLDLESPAMRPVRQALAMMLENHNPFPALVMDGNWNVLMMNSTQQALASMLVLPAAGPDSGQPNLLELVFDAHGFRPLIVNWQEVASHLLRRLRKQMLAYSKPAHVELYTKLLTMNPPPHWQQPRDGESTGPMLTLDMNFDGKILRLFSTLSQFGTALDVGMEELLIESYFPANEESRDFFASLTTQQPVL